MLPQDHREERRSLAERATMIEHYSYDVALVAFLLSSRICQRAWKPWWKWKCRLLSRVWLFATPWTVRLLCPWDSPGKNIGLPFPSPGDLPDPGIEPGSPALPCLVLPRPKILEGILGYSWGKSLPFPSPTQIRAASKYAPCKTEKASHHLHEVTDFIPTTTGPEYNLGRKKELHLRTSLMSKTVQGGWEQRTRKVSSSGPGSITQVFLQGHKWSESPPETEAACRAPGTDGRQALPSGTKGNSDAQEKQQNVLKNNHSSRTHKQAFLGASACPR